MIFYLGFVEYRGNVIYFEENKEKVKNDSNYLGGLEIAVISKIYNISIYLNLIIININKFIR